MNIVLIFCILIVVAIMFYFLGKTNAYGKMKWYDSLPNLEIFEVIFKDKKRVLLESQKKETFVVPIEKLTDFKSLRPGDKIQWKKDIKIFTRWYDPNKETC